MHFIHYILIRLQYFILLQSVKIMTLHFNYLNYRHFPFCKEKRCPYLIESSAFLYLLPSSCFFSLTPGQPIRNTLLIPPLLITLWTCYIMGTYVIEGESEGARLLYDVSSSVARLAQQLFNRLPSFRASVINRFVTFKPQCSSIVKTHPATCEISNETRTRSIAVKSTKIPVASRKNIQGR